MSHLLLLLQPHHCSCHWLQQPPLQQQLHCLQSEPGRLSGRTLNVQCKDLKCSYLGMQNVQDASRRDVFATLYTFLHKVPCSL